MFTFFHVKRRLIAASLGCLMACGLAYGADDASPSVTLSFVRTGAKAATVNVAGIDGVTAEMTSVSHSFKEACNEISLCPDVNGNSNPTIVFEFSVTGLPADFTFNQVGFKTHAYNASADNQHPADGKNRYYNVAVETNSTEIAKIIDKDIAKDNDAGHLEWAIATNSEVTATDPMTLRLTITKGSDNQGCFFGLEQITLSTADDSEPEPVDPGNSKIYTISWQTGNQKFMVPASSGGVEVTPYSVNKMIFWEFIPTENENCYYIRNLASGQYIGSCNMTPGSSSRPQMTDTPTEYYVGQTAGTDAKIVGCVWLSSTDCANHNNETNGARALNKDGGSENVITWQNGTGRAGSYWKLTETANLYEPRPFTPSASVGSPEIIYHILNSVGLSYASNGEWVAPSEFDKTQRWYFVGENNTAGGYQIVAEETHEPLDGGQEYKLYAAPGGKLFKFMSGETALELADEDEFYFAAARTPFALNHQIYNMPCGGLGDVFITKVEIGPEFHYPMATVNAAGELTYPAATKPGNKYVILSKDAAKVEIGAKTPLTIALNKAPSAKTTLTLFIDWNKDGVFEYAQELTPATSVEAEITVPEDAKPGVTRARIRLNDNGRNGAEDEVHGEVLDLRLQMVSPTQELIDPTVSVNDPNRGEAAWADGVATATPKGNALFLYWKEGKRVASVSANYEVAASTSPRELTAVFSVNTEPDEVEDPNKPGDDTGNDDPNKGDEDALAQIELATGSISVAGHTLSVDSEFDVIRILVFSLDGKLAASASASTSVTLNLPTGLYIAKAITAGGTITEKICL